MPGASISFQNLQATRDIVVQKLTPQEGRSSSKVTRSLVVKQVPAPQPPTRCSSHPSAPSARALGTGRERSPERRPGGTGAARAQRGASALSPLAAGRVQHRQGRGGAGLAALTCSAPRGGWCGPGTRTQRPPADRGSTPGPARPARGPGASSSADTWRRRSPWPGSVRRPVPGPSKSSRQGRCGVRRAAAREGLAGERRPDTGRARAPVRKGGREGARRAGRVTQQPRPARRNLSSAPARVTQSVCARPPARRPKGSEAAAPLRSARGPGKSHTPARSARAPQTRPWPRPRFS